MTHVTLNQPPALHKETLLEEERQQLLNVRSSGSYEDPRSSINLPYDEELHTTSVELSKEFLDAAAVVVIGIGGSNLGTIAVHEAINGLYANELRTPKAYFADTIDSNDLQALTKQLDKHYANNERVVLVGISKSGGTTETIANLQLLVEHKKRHVDNWTNDVVIITGKDSKLDGYAKKHHVRTAYIPSGVGGRYSVLSPVGIIPLAILGIDTQKLLVGARKALKESLGELASSPAAQRASNRHEQLTQEKDVHELFVFSKQLRSVGAWTRQLLAESLGKDGRGFTPTTAVGSTDLHSVAQLRLAGKNHAHTTFLTVQETARLELPGDEDFSGLVEDLQEKPLADVLTAIADATKHAYKQAGRSYDEIVLEEINEESIGYVLQLLMLETMYLAAQLEINAYNQPAVEKYKNKTRELLQE